MVKFYSISDDCKTISLVHTLSLPGLSIYSLLEMSNNRIVLICNDEFRIYSITDILNPQLLVQHDVTPLKGEKPALTQDERFLIIPTIITSPTGFYVYDISDLNNIVFVYRGDNADTFGLNRVVCGSGNIIYVMNLFDYVHATSIDDFYTPGQTFPITT